jgi:hypothetical protein
VRSFCTLKAANLPILHFELHFELVPQMMVANQDAIHDCAGSA